MAGRRPECAATRFPTPRGGSAAPLGWLPAWRHAADTEVLAHLIGSIYQQLNGKDSKARLVNAVRDALKQVIGTYGIAVIHSDIPNFIVGARRGSPPVRLRQHGCGVALSGRAARV